MDRTLRDAFGYSLEQYDVLHHLAGAAEPVRMETLADQLLVANSSCTYIVKGLAVNGLVKRHEMPGDRRAVGVALTPTGRATYRKVARVHAADIERLFGRR